MLSNQSVTNEKPRDLAVTKPQDIYKEDTYNSKSTALSESKSRYEKGMGLYKSGRVSIGPNGLFKVSGFQVDTERMQCDCPDYNARKEACKHLFAALLFVKNRGKEKMEGPEGFNGNGHAKTEVKVASNKPLETRSKPFDRQSTRISPGLRSLTLPRRFLRHIESP